MAVTPSNLVQLGSPAPSFSLLDVVSSRKINLDELNPQKKATVIMFICNHCPYVIYLHDALMKLTNEYLAKGIAFIAINSNDVNSYPEDSPEKMKLLAKELNFQFPYLFDETQEVAKSYAAACTPDFFVYDENMQLAYHGQFDDARPGSNNPITGIDLRNALDALLDNKPVAKIQKPSIGCNIKWKS